MDVQPIINQLTHAVESSALTLHLAALPGPRACGHNGAARTDALRYLRDTLRGYGWQVADQQCADEHGVGTNIIATLPGAITPHRTLILAAHHDTVPHSPGADADGSGLAALLELARLLAGRRWAASVQIVAFDLHATTRAGSKAYLGGLGRSATEVIGALIFDQIGYHSREQGSQEWPTRLSDAYPEVAEWLEQRGRRGDFLATMTTRHGEQLMRSFLEWAEIVMPTLAIAPLAVHPGSATPALLEGDHELFWAAGLPALLLTDTGALRNPYFHQPSDAPGTLDPSFWRRIVAAALATSAVLIEPA